MAEFDAPQSRNEAILQNILGADNVLLPPQSRNEAILQNILGADNVLLPPQSRIEELLMQLLEEWPVGPQGVPENDVNFYDYDGSIVASYTVEEFAALEEMPENPDHTSDGLTSQGWNWSLANAKAYVAKYGRLNIGQMYVPTDGKTHVFIDIPIDDLQYSLELYFGATSQIVIDWGDGSQVETAAGTLNSRTHTYSSPGKYEVSIDVSGGGKLTLQGTANSKNAYHFNGYGGTARNLSRVKKIYLGSNAETIGNSAFYQCNSLEIIVIPNTVTTINDFAFYNCYNLASIILPNSVRSIGESAFTNCVSAKIITIPSSVTSIGANALYSTYTLKHIEFPDGVTNISSGILRFAPCIKNIILPDSVTNIGANAFASCHSAIAYHITSTMPPTLENTNAFNNIAPDTVIYVPAASLNAYKTASNWSTYADRMVAE